MGGLFSAPIMKPWNDARSCMILYGEVWGELGTSKLLVFRHLANRLKIKDN